MKLHHRLLSGLSATLLLAGCVSQGIVMGEMPSEPAPQLAFLGARNAKNQDYLTWENVSSFGKVPPQLQATADVSCMRLGLELRATGYHPHARGRNGQEIPGGGFFCQVVVPVGYGSLAPRWVNQAWDHPGAFGAIPTHLLDTAASECGKQNKKPLAYHPNALDADGHPMPGGGYLCTQ